MHMAIRSASEQGTDTVVMARTPAASPPTEAPRPARRHRNDVAVLVGAAVAVVGLVSSGRRVRRTRYRPDPWRVEESLVALSGAAVGAVFWWIGGHDLLVAHPGVESVPYLSVAALGAVLLGLLAAVAAPPPRHALAPPLAVGA